MPLTESNDTGDNKFSLVWDHHQANLRKSFFSKLKDGWKNGAETDVVLICSDGHELVAQKLLLGSCSVYFSNLLQDTSCKKVKLNCIDRQTMSIVLDYIYSIEFNNSKVQCDYSTLSKLLQAAYTLQIDTLIDFCCSCLENLITVDNFNHTWELNELCKNETLDKHLQRYFQGAIGECLRCDYFLNFSMTLMEFALGKWRGFLKPEYLVVLLLQWVKHDTITRECFLVKLFLLINTSELSTSFLNHFAFLHKYPEIVKLFREDKFCVDILDINYQDHIIPSSVQFLCFANDKQGSRVHCYDFLNRIGQTHMLPFNLVDEMCGVQYKEHIYFIGGDPSCHDHSTFVQYNLDTNTFIEKPAILKRVVEPIAGIVENSLFFVGKDLNRVTVQRFDFDVNKWEKVDKSFVKLCQRFISHANVLYMLEKFCNISEQKNINISSNRDESIIMLPYHFQKCETFLYNDQIWGFNRSIGKKCIYDIIKDSFTLKPCPKLGLCDSTIILPISALKKIPMFVTVDLDSRVVKLWNFEEELELGKICIPYEIISMGMVYCKDLSL